MIFLESKQHIDYLNGRIKDEKDLYNLTFDVIHGKLAEKQIKDDRGNLKMVTDGKINNKLIEEKYKDFRKGEYTVLLCTDIMARGIDIPNAGLVLSVFVPRYNNRDKNSELE